MSDTFAFPELSASAQAFIRSGYGLLMAATIAQAVPEARRFFVSERWGGYAESTPAVDAIQNPLVMPLVLSVWMASALAVMVGWMTPWAALLNLVFCRYFFVHMRWKGVLRGMGAPGFMSYWLGFVVFLLEVTAHHAPQVRSLVLLVAQVDFAFIMLSAGIYKATAGYCRNEGMEFGLCNPMWGRWPLIYKAWRPSSPTLWTLNQLAWATEVVGALLILYPPTRELGGGLIALSFVYVLTQIRLGFLCEKVILGGLLCVQAGSMVDRWIAMVTGPVTAPSLAAGAEAWGWPGLLVVLLWGYLALLPLAHAGLFYNFYARRALPGVLQRALERYTNTFGIIIWRVFSVDLVNFFIRMYRQPKGGGARIPYPPLASWPRFNHVGEMICVTSLFTTLKYYSSNEALFHKRLLRYAKTFHRDAGDLVIFEYVRVAKRRTHFDWVPVLEFHADVDRGTVAEHQLDPAFSARVAAAVSPVHEGAVPGSYVPAPR